MNDTTGWSHETVLAAEPGNVSKARNFIGQYLAAHDLQYLSDDVRLVTSELATNAIEHARTPFVLTLCETGGVVRLTVRDGSSSVPMMTTPHVMDLSGRGLVLVQQLSHEWGATTDASGSKSVWASFVTRAGFEPAALWA